MVQTMGGAGCAAYDPPMGPQRATATEPADPNEVPATVPPHDLRSGPLPICAPSEPSLPPSSAPREKTLLGIPERATLRDTTGGHAADSPGSIPAAVAALWSGAAPLAIDPQTVLDDVASRVRRRADCKAVGLVVRCASTRIWVRRQAFSEAVYQLVLNAVDASPRGSPVTLDVRDTQDADALLQIQDAGNGMSEETLGDLGRPRGEDSDWKHGVVFAWAIILKHDGLLHFESAPGFGTTATIWLPGHRDAVWGR